MDLTKPSPPQVITQLGPQVWYRLRDPRLTVGLGAVVAVLLAVLAVVPQAGPGETVTAWMTRLPAGWQGFGPILYEYGGAHLLRSFWFWLPVAALLLNSIVILADYAVALRRRWSAGVPDVTAPYPLVSRVEHVVRLTESPEGQLDRLAESLRARGWQVQPTDEETRLVAAARRPRAWAGPVFIYGGLVVLVGGLLLTRYFGQAESLTLAPAQPVSTGVLAGEVVPTAFEPERGAVQVAYTPPGADDPRQLSWRLYQPTLVQGAVLVPVAMESLLTIEVVDANGERLRMLPPQADLPLTDRLTLRLPPESPGYFGIPADNLAVQVTVVDEAAGRYNIQVRADTERAPFLNETVGLGDSLPVRSLTLSLSRTYTMSVGLYRDPGLLAYGLAVGLGIVGAVWTLWRRPGQVWLIPEVKGRGGQLYGVAETFGPGHKLQTFLEDLLAQTHGQAQQDETVEADS